MGKKVTTEIFLERAKLMHGDKYDYSKAEYVNYSTKICIICPKHGEFWLYPADHTKGCGCPKCGKERSADTNRSTTEEFIRKAKLVHGCFYDYSKVDYKSATNKVTIICPVHGEFELTPNNHLNGQHCPKCGKIIATNKITKTLDEFLELAQEIHGNIYDYSIVKYLNNYTPVKIICREHGEFELTPYKHLIGQGCPKCGVIKAKEFSTSRASSVEEFIKKAKEVHGDKYDYSKVNYINNHTKVIIICPIHGEFKQTPAAHVSLQQGCPKCNQSKGEENIELFLKNKDILFISQYVIECPDSIRISKKCYIDFYIPDFNLFIEYNGKQHYVPVEQFGGQVVFEKQQIRDSYVRQYCKEHNINLLEIKYDLNINEVLSNVFKSKLE